MPISTQLLHDLCALPTAAFLEEAVYAYIDKWAKRRRGLLVETDRFGNRLLTLKGKTDGPRLVMVAHTDHPAFVAMQLKKRQLFAEFRGGVNGDCVAGAVVRFFTPTKDVKTKVREFDVDKNGRITGATFHLPKGAEVPPGSIGMWDFGKTPVKESKGQVRARACDDLAGIAAGLAAMDELRAKRPQRPFAILLTRAEEVGFVGAIAAVKDRGGLLRKDDRLISIETSSAQPAAPIGKGCVLRIGDRTSVFHSGLSYFLNERGESLAKAEKSFKFTRALMPGGTCEGTVFDAYGYIASAVCVPLGNYHNMDRENLKMGPEFIDVNDWRSLVMLLADAGRHHHTFDGKTTALRMRLDDRLASHRHLFTDPTLTLSGDRAFESR